MIELLDKFLDNHLNEFVQYPVPEPDKDALEIEIPGAIKDTIEIEIVGSRVLLTAKTKSGRNITGSYWIGPNVDVSRVTAKYEDGILYINLQRQDQVKRLIKID